MLDIKAKIEEIAKKVQEDDALKQQFQSDPVKAIEGLLGVDLPDDMVEKVVSGVKTKIGLDALGGLFGKK